MRETYTNKANDLGLPKLVGQPEITFHRVDVKMNSLLEEFAAAYALNLTRNAIRLTDDEAHRLISNMEAYIKTLIYVRCNQTSREVVTYKVNDKPYREPDVPSWMTGKRYWAIPPFISVLVMHIGYVNEPSIGIELEPKKVSVKHFLDEDTFLFIERLIKSIPGSDYSTEFPTSKLGDWATMSLCVIEDRVVGNSHEIPGVHAVIASFLNTTGLETILMPRVTYGSLQFFKTFISKLSELKI